MFYIRCIIHTINIGALAMEALHKQTLPFLLRRVKEDVLQDLPPKIIQDYYCELSSLQVWLYLQLRVLSNEIEQLQCGGLFTAIKLKNYNANNGF